MPLIDVDAAKQFLGELAQLSQDVILPYFANPRLVIEQKEDQTPVTAADREAEAALRKRIRERYPDHGIIGEEYGSENAEAEFVWVLDPVDGTKSFAAHNAQFGTLICLLQQGRPIVSAINLPATRQLLIGDNQTCTLNGNAVRVTDAPELDRAIVVTTELRTPAKKQDPRGWEELTRRAGRLYTWGDCYAYYLLCAGGVHVACDPIMNPWDLLPLLPVLRGAGAAVSGWRGEDAERASSLVAAHPRLHEQVLAILNP